METSPKEYKTPSYIRKASKNYYDSHKDDLEFIEKRRAYKREYARKMRELKKQERNNIVNQLVVV